jgi:hypothetical protein
MPVISTWTRDTGLEEREMEERNTFINVCFLEN